MAAVAPMFFGGVEDLGIVDGGSRAVRGGAQLGAEPYHVLRERESRESRPWSRAALLD